MSSLWTLPHYLLHHVLSYYKSNKYIGLFFLFIFLITDKPPLQVIGSGCMCVAVGVKVQIGTEKKIAKERKEDRGACVSCAER